MNTKEKIICIYKITNPKGRIYIGQSSNYKRRLESYKYLRCKKQIRLYSSFLKYGYENHKIEIIESCSFENLNKRERYYQDLYEVTTAKGMNCVLTETNSLSRVISSETRYKIGCGNRNKPMPEHVKQAIIKANTGRKKTEKEIEFTSRLHKGRVDSLETRLKRSGENHWTKREGSKGFSEEHKEKMKASNHMKKKVINIKTKEIFDSAAEVNRELGWRKDRLSKHLRGERVNYTDFLYLEDYEKNIK